LPKAPPRGSRRPAFKIGRPKNQSIKWTKAAWPLHHFDQRSGVWFGDNAAARALARECNDFAAKTIKDYPGRFGLFATLPMPDVEGALREIEYAFDTLKADGACVLSSYGGKYLGNPTFAPVMDELNRRKAVVFCHPYCAACGTQTVLGDGQNRGVEFVFDTTRTIVSLLSSATVTRCPDIRFIWSHGGGTVPYITSRLNGVAQQLPKGLIYELQKFYYDTAQAFNPYTLPSFKKLVPASHIVFGTDFPLGGGSGAAVSKGLIENGGFSESELRGIDRENALELLRDSRHNRKRSSNPDPLKSKGPATRKS